MENRDMLEVFGVFSQLFQQTLASAVQSAAANAQETESRPLSELISVDAHRHHRRRRELRRQLVANEPEFCRRSGRVSYGSVRNLHRNRPRVLVAEVPLSAENSYFELEIQQVGASGSIAIGLVPDGYPTGKQPGWCRRSIGYHADDGGIFIERGFPEKTKEKCYRGDRMGCGLEIRDGNQLIYFTKNGQTVAEQPFGSSLFHLYPAVGMNSVGEEVQLLNQEIWKFGTNNDEVIRREHMRNDDEQQSWNVVPGPPAADMLASSSCSIGIFPTGHMTFLWREASERDAITIGTVPISCNQCFFELEIFSVVDGCDVTIAIVPQYYRHTERQTMPVSFRASDGLASCALVNSGRQQHLQRRPCVTGDKMGCGIEYRQTGCVVYFTHNTSTFTECEIDRIPDDELFPAVILRSSATKTVSVCVQDCESWGFKTQTSGSCSIPSFGQLQPPTLPLHSSAVNIDVDRCTISLGLSSDGSKKCATLIAAKPFSADVSYFEIEKLAGRVVAVGAVIEDYSVEHLPGWLTGSIGYHSDDGGIFIEQTHAKIFVSKCADGDALGCGVLKDCSGCKVFFTRNGSTVTEIRFGDDCKSLYPAIGLLSAGQEPAIVLVLDLASSDLWQAKTVITQQPNIAPRSPETEDRPIATGGDTKTMEKIMDELQCPICWSTLCEPKLLPCCQHTFCLRCIDQYVHDFQGPAGQIRCPVCRKTFSLPSGGAIALENNCIASRLIEITHASKQ